MLQVDRLRAGYLGSTVLDEISLTAESGITLVIGPNGAGKSTLVRCINGTLRPVEGSIRFDERSLETSPAWAIARAGVATVPERSRVFPELTIRENLQLGARLAVRRGGGETEAEVIHSVLSLFPEIESRLGEPAGRLSGGQQQMVAIARALATRPKLLLMDEPTTGLYPVLVRQLLGSIERIAKDLPILLTEQNVAETAPIARTVHLLEAGRIVLSGTPQEILSHEGVRRSYLGEGESVSAADGGV